MPVEPTVKRAVAFFDGQNLFHCAKDAFGYRWANYDPVKLAQSICSQNSWNLNQTRFYTGIHTLQGDAYLHGFWKNKLMVLGAPAQHSHILAASPLSSKDGGT